MVQSPDIVYFRFCFFANFGFGLLTKQLASAHDQNVQYTSPQHLPFVSLTLAPQSYLSSKDSSSGNSSLASLTRSNSPYLMFSEYHVSGLYSLSHDYHFTFIVCDDLTMCVHYQTLSPLRGGPHVLKLAFGFCSQHSAWPIADPDHCWLNG